MIIERKSQSVIKIIFGSVLFLYFVGYARNNTWWSFLDTANLVFHEAGHTLFYLFGQFISIFAGSFVQILIPVLFFCYFYFLKQYYSSAIILFWVGQNFINVSRYVSDAIEMNLELLGGEGVIHDWNYLLSELNILYLTPILGKTLFFLGVFLIFFAFIFLLRNSQTRGKDDSSIYSASGGLPL